MDKITNIEAFEAKAADIAERLKALRPLFNEANDLLKATDLDAMVEAARAAAEESGEEDPDDVEDDLTDRFNEAAYDLAYEGRFQYDGVRFWLPSTC